MEESILESTFKTLNKAWDKIESLIDQNNKLNAENVRLHNELKSVPNKVDDTEKQDDVPKSPLYKALTGRVEYNKKRYRNIIFNALGKKEKDIQKFLLKYCAGHLTDNIIEIEIMCFWEHLLSDVVSLRYRTEKDRIDNADFMYNSEPIITEYFKEQNINVYFESTNDDNNREIHFTW